MKNISDAASVYLLAITIFLLRLPSFYILPVSTSLLTTHNFARLLIAILLLRRFLFYKKQSKQNCFQNYLSFPLVLFFFFTQSLSVLNATNINNYLLSYKNLVFGLLLFYLLLITTNKHNIFIFIKTLVLSTIINLSVQTIALFYLPATFTLFQPFLYDKYWTFESYQASRGRFFGSSFDEIIIPFIILIFSKDKNWTRKLFYLVLIVLQVFISISSNWRTKSLLLFILLFASILGLLKKKVLMFLMVLISLFVANNYSLALFKYNVFDRLNPNSRVDISTINARINYWKEAIDIGKSSPIIGVGYGNYFDNLSSKSKLASLSSQVDRIRALVLIDDPHNVIFYIFATSGLLGLLSWLMLISRFIYIDYKSIRKQNNPVLLSLIIAFWGLFAYGLFHPVTSFSYLALFWALRGYIEKLHITN